MRRTRTSSGILTHSTKGRFVRSCNGCHSHKERLNLAEVAEVAAFDADNNFVFVIENRFAETEDILETCSSLVTPYESDILEASEASERSSNATWGSGTGCTDSSATGTLNLIRLSHYSVKE